MSLLIECWQNRTLDDTTLRDATSEGHHSSNIIDARWNYPTFRARTRDYEAEEIKSLSATEMSFRLLVEQILIVVKPIPPLGRSQYTGGGGAEASSNG